MLMNKNINQYPFNNHHGLQFPYHLNPLYHGQRELLSLVV